MKNKEKLATLSNKVTKALDVPAEIFLNTSRIEIIGNKEAIIEGCKKVLEYDENLIKITAKKMNIIFMGTELNLKRLNSEEIEVFGNIQSISFEYIVG